MEGRKRCRLHGGRATGPPLGSQNALKHGRYTATAIAERRTFDAHLREIGRLVDLDWA